MTRRQNGFTLIEMMIVVAIIGILAAIAIPNYQDYVRKSRRTDATVTISKIQQAQEKWRANNTTYSADISSAGLNISTPSTATTDSSETLTTVLGGSGYYKINIKSNNATGYIITATAQGSQANDTKCKYLAAQTTNGNVKVTGATTSAATTTNLDLTTDTDPNKCWSK